MNKIVRNSLIGAALLIGGYQIYKKVTKPKEQLPIKPEAKSNFFDKSTKNVPLGKMRYDKNSGYVYTLILNKEKEPTWVVKANNQPKAMDWFNFNGKWVWCKWNGKLNL
jgi:hypothetical protein